MSSIDVVEPQPSLPTEAVPEQLLVVNDEAITVPVIEESIQIDRKSVDRGGYRVTKRVATREETWDDVLKDGRVAIERLPVGRLLESDDAPQPRYEGEVLIIPVVREIMVKRLLLVEEVRVTRIEGTHRTPQRVTLRTEEVSIERLEPGIPSDSQPS